MSVLFLIISHKSIISQELLVGLPLHHYTLWYMHQAPSVSHNKSFYYMYLGVTTDKPAGIVKHS